MVVKVTKIFQKMKKINWLSTVKILQNKKKRFIIITIQKILLLYKEKYKKPLSFALMLDIASSLLIHKFVNQKLVFWLESFISRNIRNFLRVGSFYFSSSESYFLKYKEFFRGVRFLKYKKSFHFRKYKKSFRGFSFLKHKTSFNIRVRKFHFHFVPVHQLKIKNLLIS